ncbi:hypothetical protein HJFPF1_10502 [Paramyrothecium foliicola]|nr:hypothetical protein HJFPF1_10502 [Paramyrothecium foliicola]
MNNSEDLPPAEATGTQLNDAPDDSRNHPADVETCTSVTTSQSAAVCSSGTIFTGRMDDALIAATTKVARVFSAG